MFQHILVAVDFSPCSQVAFDIAVDLARATGAVLDVLHVFRPPKTIPPELEVHHGPGDEKLTTLVRERVQEELDALLAKAGVRVGEAILEDGQPAERIIARASASDCDLVVVGTHGRTGLSHALIGSVAETVVRLCPKPVLSVRARDSGAASRDRSGSTREADETAANA
jgi:universal stress protein A